MISVSVDSGKVTVALGTFRATLQDRQELLRVIGEGQLQSIYKTFAEQGSPAGSWPPLSPNSVRWNKKAGAGHKLLIMTGRMRNSIRPQVQGNAVVIGTNVRYAPVHQHGFDGTQSVKGYSYTRRSAGRGPGRSTRLNITNEDRYRHVDEAFAFDPGLKARSKVGKSGEITVTVRPFSRHLHIPARPFLVFRPEDPERIRKQVQAFVVLKAKQAGLEAH